MKLRNKAVPAVYILLKKDGKILVSRRCNTGYQDGKYQVASGHVEEEELPLKAMVREAKEEIGIDVVPEDLKFVHVMYRSKHDETGERVDIFFSCERWKGEVKNMEPHKCDDMKWVNINELPEEMIPFLKNSIQFSEKGILYSEGD